MDVALKEGEVLWKSCSPTSIIRKGNDIILEIPFQKQKVSADIVPDKEVKRKKYFLKIRAYGKKILRVGIGFGSMVMKDSPMLEISASLSVSPLITEITGEEWLVKDSDGAIRASVNRKPLVTDHWSDLIGAPEETLQLSFFPDEGKEISLSAYDQFFPKRQDAFPLAFIERNGQCNRITMSFASKPGEIFAGTGERFSKMDLSGNYFEMKNEDAHGVNSRRTYKCVPFFISDRMYGVFLHTSAYSVFSLAHHSSRSAQILTEEPQLDIFLIGGDTPEEILYNYRSLTGFPKMLPLWSFGTWMSRMTYFSADEVILVCDRLRREDYPCDVIHLDTGWFRKDWICEWKFSPERFPDPGKLISRLTQNGFKVSLWQMPYLSEKAEQYDEALKNRYIAVPLKSDRHSDTVFSNRDYDGTIDFTYPEAAEWYKGLLRNLLEMGVSCIKTDFGEEIHMDAVYHSMRPELLKNLYSLLYQKAAFEVTEEVKGEGIIWARAGWAGCQRYPLHWSGDSACSWDGMAATLKGGLHLGLSGFGFWSHDVPGFHGVPDFMNSVIPDDLYVRWTQFGVFTSHLRYHGTSKREPYEFPAISAIVRKWLGFRYALIPYIMEQAKKVTITGYPILRALIFHHPDDKICWHIDDQYYFGDDFLVAPVMNSENRRDVYLPSGRWVNLFKANVSDGNCWLKSFESPLEEMPVWVKYGSVIPVYPFPVKHTGEIDLKKTITITFDEHYPGIKAFGIPE